MADLTPTQRLFGGLNATSRPAQLLNANLGRSADQLFQTKQGIALGDLLTPPPIEKPSKFQSLFNTYDGMDLSRFGFTESLQSVGEREEGGGFSPLGVLTIPYQTAVALGKNIAEYMFDREVGTDDFLTDMENALTGQGEFSFGNVLEAIGTDELNLASIDLALPDEWTDWMEESPWVRWGTSIVAGVAAGFFAGPFAGIGTVFATEQALGGKGAVSATADVFLDPLNKLRMFQLTTKGTQMAKAAGKLEGSVLQQLLRGQRQLFDFGGDLFIGKGGFRFSNVEKAFEFASRPIQLVPNAGFELLNKLPLVEPIVEKGINPFTGAISRGSNYFAKTFFDRLGHIKLASGLSEDVAEKVAKQLDDAKALADQNQAKLLVRTAVNDLIKLNPTEQSYMFLESLRASVPIESTATGPLFSGTREAIDFMRGRATSPWKLLKDELPDAVPSLDQSKKKFFKGARTEETRKMLGDIKTMRDDLVQKSEAFDDVRSQLRQAKKTKNKALIDAMEIETSRAEDALNTARSFRDEFLQTLEKSGAAKELNAVQRGAVTPELGKIFRNMVEYVWGEDVAKATKIFFSHESAAELSDGVFVNVELIQRANQNVKETANMAMKVYASGTIEDAFRTMTEHHFRGMLTDHLAANLDNQEVVRQAMSLNITPNKALTGEAAQRASQRYTQLQSAARQFGFEEINDPKLLMEWYMTKMEAAGLYGAKIQNSQTAKFIGGAIDGIRGFIRMMGKPFGVKTAYSNKEVFDWMKSFSSDADYFLKAQDGAVTLNFKKSLEEILEKDAKTGKGKYLYLRLVNQFQTLAEQAGVLPEGFRRKLLLHGSTYHPLLPRSQYTQEIFRQKNFEAGLASKSGEATKHKELVGKKELQELRNFMFDGDEVEKFLRDSLIFDEAEWGLLKGTKNLNKFVDPNSLEYELMSRARGIFDITPPSAFVSEIGVIGWHFANMAGRPIPKMVFEAINSVAVSGENAAEQLIDEIGMLADRIGLDAADNDRIIGVLKNNFKIRKGTTRKNMQAVTKRKDDLIDLLAKDNPTSTDVLQIHGLIRSLARNLDEGSVQSMLMNLPHYNSLDDFALSPTLFRSMMNPERTARSGVTLHYGIDPNVSRSAILKDWKASVRQAASEGRDPFDEVFRNDIFKELRAKRGDFPVPLKTSGKGKRLVLDEQVLRPGGGVRNAEEIAQLSKVNEWVQFNSEKGAPLAPIFDGLNGKMVPKVLAEHITGKPVDFGGALGPFISFMEKLGKFGNSETYRKTTEGAVDKTVNALDRVFGIKVSDGLKNQATRSIQGLGFDYLTHLFKANALLSPAYHVRNDVSGAITNIMHGVGSDSMIQAFKDVSQYVRSGKKSLRSEWVREFYESGSAEAFFSKELIADTLGGAPGLNRANPLSTKFAAFEVNHRLGQINEEWIRASSFHHFRVNKGMSVEDATRMTKLLHFDYSDLSQFEDKVLKRLIPFYTYFRKALVRDTRLFMNRTGEYVKMAHIVAEVERRGDAVEKDEAVPFYVRESMGVPFRRDENGNVNYVLLRGLIPAAELAGRFIAEPNRDGTWSILQTPVVGPLLQEVFQQINPVLKLPVEKALNYDFYFGKKIQEFEGQEGSFFGQPVTRSRLHMIKNIRFLKDIERLWVASQGIRRADAPESPGVTPSQAFLRSILGVNVQVNREPERTLRFNERRGEVPNLQRLLRREARFRPGSVNIPILQQRIAQAQGQAATDRARESDVEDPLRRVFTGQGNLQ